MGAATDLAVLDEANVSGALAEASSADEHVVLADQALVSTAHAALAGALAVLAGVGVLQISHDC